MEVFRGRPPGRSKIHYFDLVTPLDIDILIDLGYVRVHGAPADVYLAIPYLEAILHGLKKVQALSVGQTYREMHDIYCKYGTETFI